MKTLYLSSGKFKYNDLSELKNEFNKLNIVIGDECELGDGCKLGETPFYAIGLYIYHVCAYYHNGTAMIQLGCYLRTLQQWENDFWNNPNEFLDHDASESKKRLFAFNIAKQWLEYNKPNQ